MGKKGGKQGKQQRKARADARQAKRDFGCQDGACQSMDVVLWLQTRNQIIRLCRACATRRGYCLTCAKKRGTLQEGVCAPCWAKIQLGMVKQEEVVNP